MVRMIALFTLMLFNENHSFAQSVLTKDIVFRRSNLEIDLRGAESVNSVSSLEKANEIFSFFEEKIYPSIPVPIFEALNKRLINIQFISDLEKAAIFIDQIDEKKPLLVKVRSSLINDPNFFRVLSHEWFHALHYVVHPNEPSWIREGLAQVFENIILGGYNGPNLIHALENSSTRLTHDFKIDEVNREAYGHVFLYFYFLYQKCGKKDFFWNLVKLPLEEALKLSPIQESYCHQFNDSVIRAELARFHNRKIKESGVSNDLYLLIPELNRSIKTVLGSKDVALVLPQLGLFEPKIFNQDAVPALKKFTKNGPWIIYSLGQTTPYSVTSGISVQTLKIPGDLIFVMKIQ